MVGGTDFRLSLFDLFKQAEFCQDAVYSRTSFRHLESRKYRGKRFLSSRLRYYSNAVSGYQLTRIVFAGDVSPNPGPVSRRSNATENLLLSAFSTIKHHGRYDITVGHTNARGLHKNLPQVKFLLFHTGLDVLAVSETHLSPAVESYENRYSRIPASEKGSSRQNRRRTLEKFSNFQVRFQLDFTCFLPGFS